MNFRASLLSISGMAGKLPGQARPGRSRDGSGADNNPISSGMSRANICCIHKVIGGLYARVPASENTSDRNESNAARVIRRRGGSGVLYFVEDHTA